MNIIKFYKLQVRSILLFQSASKCHSEIFLQSAPLLQQILVPFLLIEYHILMLKNLLVSWIPKLIVVLVCFVLNENASLEFRIQLARAI